MHFNITTNNPAGFALFDTENNHFTHALAFSQGGYVFVYDF